MEGMGLRNLSGGYRFVFISAGTVGYPEVINGLKTEKRLISIQHINIYDPMSRLRR